MSTDRNKRGDRETATSLRHQSVAMKCTGDNTMAQSSVEKQKVSGRFGQLSCIIGRQSSKLSYMKCYESGVSERLYTLIPESDAIARLRAAVSNVRAQEATSQGPARGLFKDQDHGCKLVVLYIGWTTHASGCTVIHQSQCAQAWVASL